MQTDNLSEYDMLKNAVTKQCDINMQYIKACNMLKTKEAYSVVESLIPLQLKAMDDLKEEAQKRGYKDI